MLGQLFNATIVYMGIHPNYVGEKCNECSMKHETSSCENKQPLCYYCKGPHHSTDEKCIEYERQEQMKNMMAVYKYTYFEANQILKKML